MPNIIQKIFTMAPRTLQIRMFFLYLYFLRARVCWLLLCLCLPFCIFKRRLDTNPESCRSKQGRCTNLASPPISPRSECYLFLKKEAQEMFCAVWTWAMNIIFIAFHYSLRKCWRKQNLRWKNDLGTTVDTWLVQLRKWWDMIPGTAPTLCQLSFLQCRDLNLNICKVSFLCRKYIRLPAALINKNSTENVDFRLDFFRETCEGKNAKVISDSSY